MRYISLVLILLCACTAPVKEQAKQEDPDSTSLADQEELDEFNNSDYGDPGRTYTEFESFAKEHGWTNGDGEPIPDEQYPGEIRKYFIFEDSTEMDAEGYSLMNGYPYGPSDPGNKMVIGVRFQVTLYKSMDLRFEMESYESDNSENNTHFTKVFNGAQADTAYSVVIGDTPQNSIVFCSIMRATIFAGNATAIATVVGECGD